MAETDVLLTIIWPFLGGGLITFIAMAVRGGLKMGRSTVTGSVKIEGLDERLGKVEDTVGKVENIVKEAVTELEKGIEKTDEHLRNELTKIWDRMATNTSDIKLHEYRLNEIQNNRKRGGDKSAV